MGGNPGKNEDGTLGIYLGKMVENHGNESFLR